MPDSWLVEGIKLIGGVAGLGTAAFTIWDRMVRSRPWLQVEVRATGSTRDVRDDFREYTDVIVQLHNPGRTAVVVHGVKSGIGDSFRVLFYPSVYGVLAFEEGMQGGAVIRPDEMRKFDVYYDTDLPDDLKRKRFSIRVSWRPVGALFPRWPIRRSITISQVDAWRQDTFLLEQARHERGEVPDRLFR